MVQKKYRTHVDGKVYKGEFNAQYSVQNNIIHIMNHI